jgi:hypothetical protein
MEKPQLQNRIYIRESWYTTLYSLYVLYVERNESSEVLALCLCLLNLRTYRQTGFSERKRGRGERDFVVWSFASSAVLGE